MTDASSEETFRKYTKDQGSEYVSSRFGYHASLYNRIISHHTATGGELGVLVDVGCGPGTAIRALAPRFKTAIGIDPSEGMIATAKKLGDPIDFVVSSAEEMRSDKLGNGSVDLLVSATAAHWFDMEGFWPRAAELLKPGGTLAIWVGNVDSAHPSMPNADAISAAMEELEQKEIVPYYEVGNHLARALYKGIGLPWTIQNPVAEFPEDQYVRLEWGTEGNESTDAEGNEFLEMPPVEITLGIYEKIKATASPVTRWREANPDKVGTEEDVVRVMRRTIEGLLREAGVKEGEEVLRGGVTATLMMFKRV